MGKSEPEKKIKRTGILGGTFDPIHIGHLIIAEKAREEFNLQKVLFIPTGIPPHKEQPVVSKSHRFNMVKIAIKNNKYFKINDIEIKKNEPSYTYETIIKLKLDNPATDFFLIIGEDSLYELKTWYRYEELVKEVVFLVAPRINFKKINPPEIPDLKYYYIHSPLLDISSSYIRDCFMKGKSVKYLIPDEVIKYIRRFHLYESG